MAKIDRNLGEKAAVLKRGLYTSYFILTTIGLILLSIGLFANIWLSKQAIQTIEVSAPKVEYTEKLITSLETSRADLNSWINEQNSQYKLNRRSEWKKTIYSSLNNLKEKQDANSNQQIDFIKLEKNLRDLEQWQWLVEDIAHSDGNNQARFIIDSKLKGLVKSIQSSSSALIEIQLNSNNLNSNIVSTISELRSELLLSFTQLEEYVLLGFDYSKTEFIKSLKHSEFFLNSLKNQPFNSSSFEQLKILNNSFEAYQYYSNQSLSIRSKEDWNVAQFWLKTHVIPITQNLGKQLKEILIKEKLELKKDANQIQWLSTFVPLLMMLLLLLMIFVALYLSRKATNKFVNPVIKLEKEDQLKSDLVALNSQILGINNVKELCHKVIQHISNQLNAASGAIFVAEDGLLRMRGSYAISNKIKFSHPGIEPGEGVVGQVYLDKKATIIEPEINENFNIQSSLVNIIPKHLVVFPIVFQGNVTAVIELATLNSFSVYEKEFIELSLKEFGTSLNTVQQGELIQQALVESQAQSEELEAQQEELKTTNEALETQKEELRVTNDDLQVKSKAIVDANNALTEKSKNLEEQSKILIKAEAETAEKAHQLAESSRYKSEFLANMSHELRTPLNSLLILAKMLAENDEQNLNEDQIESASVIHDSGTHLLNLINDILDLSKIEAGRMDVAQETVIIKELAASMSTRFKHMAQNKGIEFIISGSQDCVESIVSDGVKVIQILTNLIGNSIKFTSTGTVTLDFSVVNSEGVHPGHEKLLALSVIDTGIGIEEEKQTSIFEAFQQEDGSTSRNFGGTGLGLSISIAYSRLLGGDVQLKSTKGEGSTFTLYLPLHIAIGQVNTAKEHLPNLPENVGPNNFDADLNLSIPENNWVLSAPPFDDDQNQINQQFPLLLVVEDDPKFSKILYKESKKHGYQCIIAPDAESGLALVNEYQVSGILLDLSLPGMDGKEFLKRVTADDAISHIPVHIISALDNSGEEIRHGALGYFTKPVNKLQITEALDRISYFSDSRKRHLLLIEDDDISRKTIKKLLSDDAIKITEATSASEATELLKNAAFDTVILDLGLPDKNGFDWLDEIDLNPNIKLPPLIIYSAKDLDKEEELRLSNYTDSIIIKTAKSSDRLLDEVSLFLHSVKESSEKKARKGTSKINQKIKGITQELKNKRVLVVDDDMRNTFALSKALRSQGMIVEMASGGEQALQKLAEQDAFDIVLMDIMMPGMDGYETTHEIRKITEYRDLPIIAVTAKAMKGDKEKCLKAGANDYLSKPIDMDKLKTSMLTWF